MNKMAKIQLQPNTTPFLATCPLCGTSFPLEYTSDWWLGADNADNAHNAPRKMGLLTVYMEEYVDMVMDMRIGCPACGYWTKV